MMLHMRNVDAFAILGLELGVASPKLIRDTYLNLSKNPTSEYRHPDIGGDVGMFATLGAAYKVATDYALAEVCPTCGGTGKLNHMKGFQSTEITCTCCRGSTKKHARL